MRRSSRCCAVTVTLLLAACADGATGGPTTPTAVAALAPDRATDVVPGEFLAVVANRAGAGAAAAVLARHAGARVLTVWDAALHGFWFSADAETLERVRSDPAVLAIVPNTRVHANVAQPCAPYLTCSWGLDRIDETNLPMDGAYVHQPKAGRGVTAYLIDSGLRISHQDFGGRAAYGFDFVDNDAVADDCNGHGTHVGGVVGGTSWGVAKLVHLVAVRVLDCAGNGTAAGAISGVNWVTANAVKPAVANVSFSGPPNAVLDSAVIGSINAGVAYSVAAGDANQSACNVSPGRLLPPVVVASTGSGGGIPPASPDQRSPTSNFGFCVDLFAPGLNIRSDWSASDTATAFMSGTSVSTAFVTGTSAIILSYYPLKTPFQVWAMLDGNASNGVVGNPGPGGTPNKLLNMYKPRRP